MGSYQLWVTYRTHHCQPHRAYDDEEDTEVEADGFPGLNMLDAHSAHCVHALKLNNSRWVSQSGSFPPLGNIQIASGLHLVPTEWHMLVAPVGQPVV